MSRETVIRRIVERETKRQTLIEERVLQDAPDLHQTACDLFGTWETAMIYAGVPARFWRVNYSGERIIRWIRRHAKERYCLRAGRVQQRDPRLHRDALRLFGSWAQALNAAGVVLCSPPYPPKPGIYVREDVLTELRAWGDAGYSLRWCDLCAQNRRLAEALRRFGGWTKVLLAMGYSEQQLSNHRVTWDREKIVDFIRNRRQTGEPLELENISEEDIILIWAARHYFGSWECALDAATESQHLPCGTPGTR